jgi:hypothetical protein
MHRLSSTISPGPHGGSPGRRRTACLLTLAAVAVPATAGAEGVVLPDPAAAPENAELAGAVSLLVRSYLKPGKRPLVPRRELALALEAVTGRSPSKVLTVPTNIAPKLMDRLAADGLVLWELELGKKGTSVAGTLVGPGGKRQLRILAVAATGDIAELSRLLAKKIAPAIGATVGEMPDVGLAELRPFVAAQSALVSGDAVAASRAVDLALPTVVARLDAAKDALLSIAEDAALPALPRAQARLLRGEWNKASELAESGLAIDARNASLRAVNVRALAALKDFAAAERELAQLKGSRNLAALALAQVALAIERGDPVARKDEALAALVGRPAGEWRQVLPLIAATPPGTFGPRIEAAALAAAEKLSSQEPGLASTLAARALAGGAAAEQTAGLIKVNELSAEQIKALSARLTAEADASSAGLSQQLKAREEEAKEIAEQAGPQKPTGPPSALARNLLPVLQNFDALYEPSLSAIQIAPLPGSGQPFYWPFLVRRQNLTEGLLETLMRSPWELQATSAKLQTETLPPDRMTDEGIASLAHDLGCNALLLYRIRPAGIAPWVTLDLVLHDALRQRTDRIEASLVGRSTGLVMLNPLMIVLAVLAFLAALGWAIVISLRGTIQVRVQWDSDAKDELFSILISRSQHTPTIENLTAYRKKLEWLGKRKRHFESWNIDQNTTFRGIPRGKWYVHLYGLYTRGRQVMQLHEPPQEAVVLPRKTTFVVHVLEAAEAEFKLKVIDDHGPVEGAHVWLDENRAKPLATGKDGSVSVKVEKGYHVIHVAVRGMLVDRPYHVVKAKVHEMTINLVWERRQEYVSRALERQVDDAASYMTYGPRAGSTASGVPKQPTMQEAAHPPSLHSGQTAASPDQPVSDEPPVDIPVPVEDSPIVDLTPAPAPSAPPRASARTASLGSTGKPTMNLKPLAPEPATNSSPRAMAPAQTSASNEETPLDIDVAGSLRRAPPAAAAAPPTAPRKPGR